MQIYNYTWCWRYCVYIQLHMYFDMDTRQVWTRAHSQVRSIWLFYFYLILEIGADDQTCEEVLFCSTFWRVTVVFQIALVLAWAICPLKKWLRNLRYACLSMRTSQTSRRNFLHSQGARFSRERLNFFLQAAKCGTALAATYSTAAVSWKRQYFSLKKTTLSWI